MFHSTYFSLGRRRSLTGLALLAALSGCGDDGAVINPTETDASSNETDAALSDDSSEDVDAGNLGQDAATPDTPDAQLPDSHQIPPDAGEAELRCAEMASVCHAFDFGGGDLASQCHQIGHTGNGEACTPELHAECMAVCREDAATPDASTPLGDASTPDAGQDYCHDIGHLCHDLDTGPDAGLAHQCHEVGHAGNQTACAEIYDECITLCAPAGDAGDAG